MKMKNKKEIFRYDLQKCGIVYAVAWFFDLPYVFDYSKNHILRQISERAFNWCDQRLKSCSSRKNFLMTPAEFLVYEPGSHGSVKGSSGLLNEQPVMSHASVPASAVYQEV